MQPLLSVLFHCCFYCPSNGLIFSPFSSICSTFLTLPESLSLCLNDLHRIITYPLCFFHFHWRRSLLDSMIVCFISFHLSSTVPYAFLFSKPSSMMFAKSALMDMSCRRFTLKRLYMYQILHADTHLLMHWDHTHKPSHPLYTLSIIGHWASSRKTSGGGVWACWQMSCLIVDRHWILSVFP